MRIRGTSRSAIAPRTRSGAAASQATRAGSIGSVAAACGSGKQSISANGAAPPATAATSARGSQCGSDTGSWRTRSRPSSRKRSRDPVLCPAIGGVAGPAHPAREDLLDPAEDVLLGWQQPVAQRWTLSHGRGVRRGTDARQRRGAALARVPDGGHPTRFDGFARRREQALRVAGGAPGRRLERARSARASGSPVPTGPASRPC